MSERTLFDARVRAWVVNEGNEVACYLGICFKDAPQLTVRAAAHRAGSDVVGAIGKGNLDDYTSKFFWTFQSRGKSPDTLAARTKWWESLSSDERQSRRAGWLAIQKEAPKGSTEAQKWKWWDTRGPGKRHDLREKYGYDNGGFFSDVAKALTKGPIADVASVAFLPLAATRAALTPKGQAALNVALPGAGTAIAKGQQAVKAKNAKELASVLLTEAGKLVPANAKKVLDIGSKAVNAPTKAALADAAKLRSAAAAASIIKSPSVLKQMVNHGVPVASVFGASVGLNAMAKSIEAKINAAQGKARLARISAATASALVKKANPKLSAADLKKKVDSFVYLTAGS